MFKQDIAPLHKVNEMQHFNRPRLPGRCHSRLPECYTWILHGINEFVLHFWFLFHVDDLEMQCAIYFVLFVMFDTGHAHQKMSCFLHMLVLIHQTLQHGNATLIASAARVLSQWCHPVRINLEKKVGATVYGSPICKFVYCNRQCSRVTSLCMAAQGQCSRVAQDCWGKDLTCFTNAAHWIRGAVLNLNLSSSRRPAPGFTRHNESVKDV